MDTFVKADVFFFISSLGFIFLFILVAVFLIYLISLLRSVKRITEKLEGDMKAITEEAKDLISDIKDSRAFRFLFGVKKPRRSRLKKESQ